MADHPTITFQLSKPWSQFSSRVEKGILTNNQIVSNSFYIPYLPCQGAFSDTDVWFSVELFCADIQIYACDIEFVLFDDMQTRTPCEKENGPPPTVTRNTLTLTLSRWNVESVTS